MKAFGSKKEKEKTHHKRDKFLKKNASLWVLTQKRVLMNNIYPCLSGYGFNSTQRIGIRNPVWPERGTIITILSFSTCFCLICKEM